MRSELTLLSEYEYKYVRSFPLADRSRNSQLRGRIVPWDCVQRRIEVLVRDKECSTIRSKINLYAVLVRGARRLESYQLPT